MSEDVLATARLMFEAFRDEGVPVSRRTRSMYPFLKGGERLLWATPDRELRFGEVIIFCLPGRPAGAGADVPEEERGPELGDSETLRSLRDLLHGSLVVHRVVGHEKDGRLVTKGDNLPHLDRERVAPDAVLGIVRVVRGHGGCWRLDTGGAHAYGVLAASISRLGALKYSLAAGFDAALRRVVPPVGSRRVMRLAVRFGQRLFEGLLYVMLFRLLHRRDPELCGESRI